MDKVFGVSSNAELPKKKSREVEQMENEFYLLNNAAITEQETITNKINAENFGADIVPKPKQPIVFNYCKFDETELIYQKEVECDFNEGIFKKIYKCPTCEEKYFSLLGDNNLKLVRDPSVKPIVEIFE